ncbi:MAG: AAA family ATPase [Clostridia bacterium]|nr:AAA family ATPase [Clostridia bacterium]
MNNNIFDYIKSNLNTLAEESKGIPSEYFMQHKVETAQYMNASVVSRCFPALLNKLTDPHNIYYPTGFDKLDKIMGGGLEPGSLTVIGGLAGVGKTTLALQMAYYISSTQRKDVLFLPLEMTDFQMQVKLISMLTAAIAKRRDGNTTPPLSTNQIRNSGKWGELSQDAAELYISAVKEIQSNPHLYFCCPKERATPDTIRECIKRHKDLTGEAPVLFVDYLQYIKPVKATATDKQAVDCAVEVLKEISIEYDTPVVALSSLSRSAYNTPNIGATKGSGEIEYTASTVLLLTPPADSQEEKARNIDNKKATIPGRFIPSIKKLQLTAVKNRSANTNYYMPLNFWEEFNFFTEG